MTRYTRTVELRIFGNDHCLFSFEGKRKAPLVLLQRNQGRNLGQITDF